MIYRKVTKLVAAAFFAAFLSGGGSGTSVFAQQNNGIGCTSCASCSQAISFPSSNVSSMPSVATQAIYAQPLPATSSFSSPQVFGTVYPAQPTQLSGPISSGVISTYPTATFASGSVVVSEGAVSEPIGTLTSMPTTSFVQPATAPTYVQPSTVTQPVYYPAARPTPVRSTLSTGYRTVSNGIANVTSGLAQMKAQQAASGSVRGHIGGGLGGARYEGVGWSNRSPQAAIEQCCYWGTRPTAQIGVSRSADGCWYACVLYY